MVNLLSAFGMYRKFKPAFFLAEQYRRTGYLSIAVLVSGPINPAAAQNLVDHARHGRSLGSRFDELNEFAKRYVGVVEIVEA